MGYKKVGRGNVSPITMNLVKIGIKHGICLGERTKADEEGFVAELEEILHLAETSLVDRFKYICNQNVKAGLFLYENGVIAGSKESMKKGIYETMKHGTNALGYCGLAESCQAMFGKDHADNDKHVSDFALKIVKRIDAYAKEASERNDLNFSAYASPNL